MRDLPTLVQAMRRVVIGRAQGLAVASIFAAKITARMGWFIVFGLGSGQEALTQPRGGSLGLGDLAASFVTSSNVRPVFACTASGKFLLALDGDVEGLDLHRVGPPANALCRHDRRSETAEDIDHNIATPGAVVQLRRRSA